MVSNIHTESVELTTRRADKKIINFLIDEITHVTTQYYQNVTIKQFLKTRDGQTTVV